MNLSFSSNHPGAIHPILQIVLGQNRKCGKELNTVCPLNSSDNICLSFLLYLSFLYVLHDPTPLLIPPGDVEGHDEHPGEGGEEEELEQDGHGGAAQRGPYTRKIHSQ